jgi:phage FluMu gp28-like protein
MIAEIARIDRFPSLRVNFWQFQKDFIKDPGRFIAAMWCRGAGKSFITALKIVLSLFENEAIKKPSNWLIVSASATQAKEALRLVEGWAKALYAIAVKSEIIETEVEFRTKDNLERYTRYELRLGNGTRVFALSASPAAIRGYTANIWWDEACFFADDASMWQSLQHCTRGRLRVIVTSTPIGGSERKFHQIIHDNSLVRGLPLWSKHECDIYRAIAEGRVYDLESEKAAADPFSWKQEMELCWMDAPNTWFKAELIAACEDAKASVFGHNHEHGRCYIGNDLGLRGDRWVAWVLEATHDFAVHIEENEKGRRQTWYTGELITREVVVLDRSKFADHDREIAKLMAKYHVLRLCVDQGGMGEKPVEDYQALYGSRAEGVLFNVENKGAMALLGEKLMSDRRLLLPQERPEIVADLRKLTRVVSAAGAIRFNADRDAGGHADRCWAMLLACNAAITPTSPIEYEDGGVRDSWTEMESFTY